MYSLLMDCGREDCMVQIVTNKDNTLLHSENVTGDNIIEMYDKCISIANKYNVSEVYIDAVGFGGLAYDYFLRESDEKNPTWKDKVFYRLPKYV